MNTIGSVSSATITIISNTTVSFVADATAATATNGSAVGLRRAFGTFTGPRAAVHPTPPPQPGGAVPIPAVAMDVGATGAIYLDQAAMMLPGTSAVGSVFIRGVHAPFLSDEQQIAYKWPDCGAAIDDRHKLKLTPHRISVTGYAGDQPADLVIELLDPKFAAAAQDIRWNSAGSITLTLTDAGIGAFKTPPTGNGKLQIWPTAIEIVGEPAGGYMGKIDIRDQNLAWAVQHLSWPKIGDPIALDATELGVSHFGIFSNSLVKAARLITKAEPELRDAIARISAAHHAMARWNDNAVRISDSAEHYEVKQALHRLGVHP